MSFPPAVWIVMGFLLGMVVGNKPFRQEVDRFIARMMGGKPRKGERASEQKTIEPPDENIRDKRVLRVRDTWFKD